MRLLFLTLIVMGSLVSPASACERCTALGDNGGPQVGQQLLFRSANGGAFQPRTLTLITPAGTRTTALPGSVNHARSEDRIDLSGTRIIGGLFEPTLSTEQARAGTRIGPVFQSSGSGLVVDATGWSNDLTDLPVTLTTNVPQRGAISYPLGQQRWGAGRAVATGAEIGDAWLVDGQMVIASRGGEAAYPSVGALLESIFN